MNIFFVFFITLTQHIFKTKVFILSNKLPNWNKWKWSLCCNISIQSVVLFFLFCCVTASVAGAIIILYYIIIMDAVKYLHWTLKSTWHRHKYYNANNTELQIIKTLNIANSAFSALTFYMVFSFHDYAYVLYHSTLFQHIIRSSSINVNNYIHKRLG